MSTNKVGILVGGTQFYIPYDDHTWSIEGGYRAPVQAWSVPAEVAAAILEILDGASGVGREAVLELGDPEDPVTIERVLVLTAVPHDDPQKMFLLLTDVRRYLSDAWFCMDVNVRRRLGDRRLVGNSLTDSVVVDSIGYAPWSIRGESDAYDWAELRDEVLAYLTQEKHGRPAISYVVDTFSIDVEAKTVQETTTDASGDVGLARAIEAIPGAGIYVDKTGVIHVYDRTLGAEIPLVETLPPALMAHGNLALVNNSGLRPQRWRIYFDYELEVRWEYRTNLAELNNSGDTPLEQALQFTRLQNVLKVTDQQLVVPEGPWGAARTVGQGTWITLAEAFEAWGKVEWGAKTLPKLTEEIVCRHWLGDALRRYAIGGVFTTHDPVWASRIAELMRSFRTCFRAHPVTWERIRHAWAVRAAVWDPVTGTRAPAPVYCNYHLMPLDHFMPTAMTQFGDDVDDSYPPTGRLQDGRTSGFSLRITDEELGIFEIERDISRYPGHASLAISDLEKIAKWDSDDVTLLEPVQQSLNPNWSLATVISCSPAAPNDLRRLYSVPVAAMEAAETAGLFVTPDSYGHEKEDRSQLAEARVAWVEEGEDEDTPENIILTLVGGGVEDDENGDLEPINLESELIPLARAVAAADLMGKLDHYEGSLAVPMNGDLVPLGSISRVTHRVTDNRAVTVLNCSAPAPHYRFEDYLSGSARSFILKEIVSRR